MSEYLSALNHVWSIYWSIFGVDFSNPYLWVAIVALEAVFVPLGAIAGYKWGLVSPQAYTVIIMAAMAGLAVNLAF